MGSHKERIIEIFREVWPRKLIPLLGEDKTFCTIDTTHETKSSTVFKICGLTEATCMHQYLNRDLFQCALWPKQYTLCQPIKNLTFRGPALRRGPTCGHGQGDLFVLKFSSSLLYFWINSLPRSTSATLLCLTIRVTSRIHSSSKSPLNASRCVFRNRPSVSIYGGWIRICPKTSNGRSSMWARQSRRSTTRWSRSIITDLRPP